MKKNVLFYLLILNLSVFSQTNIDSYFYNQIADGITEVTAPQVYDNYIIFTATGNRHAGISFEHENYCKIHSFKKINGENLKNGKTVLFYIADIPEDISEIRYRLVIDGLWSCDPENTDTVFDAVHGMNVSYLKVPVRKTYKTKVENSNSVKFTYIGEAKKQIKLAGNFNNWDPFMYELTEVVPGRYEIAINLPKGKWFYSYFSGSTQLPDTTNKNYVYTADGRRASVISIE